MKCTEEEIAEVLDGFEEEMLADLERRNGLKPNSLPRRWERPKAKVEVGGMSLDRQREVLAEAERRLIAEEKRWLVEAREANRPWIEERRRMGEYHAARKRAHEEAEYWANQRSMTRGNYDPIRLFVTEIEREEGK